MANRKYYLLYLGKENIVRAWNLGFSDITDIDLVTLGYEKEEFLSKFFPNQEVRDIFIGRLTYKPKENIYSFHYYECFFKNSSKLGQKITEYMKLFALERQKKIKEPGRIELNTENLAFREYTNFLAEEITSNQEVLNRFVADKNITNPVLKKNILGYSKSNYQNRILLWNHFKKYKELRMVSLVLESYSTQKLNCEERNQWRENYLYSSVLFDFYYDFPLYYHEAGELEKDYVPASYQENYQKVQKILQSDFDSSEIRMMYQMGGTPYVMEHIDTNTLYNSSKEDLLRLGLIDPQTFFEEQKHKK